MKIRLKFNAVVFFVFFIQTALAQRPAENQQRVTAAKPRLIVGIVVDQMRYDYLYKYASKFSEGGFKRLMKEGFLCRNANYSYVPTYTAPGHACIYTGTVPAVNGIVSNDWYDRNLRSEVYCVEDTSVHPVGSENRAGMMSPHRLMCSTITDELKLASGGKSKVIGISLKDRSAILPAGHSANAAYWYDAASKNWVSSTYYMTALPQWMQAFNARKRVDYFLSMPWNTLLPIEEYTESTADDTRYEGLFEGETKPVFPHDLASIKLKDANVIRKTPFGNTFTKEAAIETIKGENLGKGPETDFIAISFSATDYVGHMYGTHAVELEDTYARLDRDLKEILAFLDTWTGKNNVLVFLTADHGAADNVLYCEDKNIPAGNIQFTAISDSLKKYLFKLYGPGDMVLNSYSTGVYLDRTLIAEKKLELKEVQNKCAIFLSQFPEIAIALTSEDLKKGMLRDGIASFIEHGFFEQRSPDISLILKPGWMEISRATGTTHGSPYSYDTHVPLLFYGWRIQHGSSSEPVDISDIAPTISDLMNIPRPNGATGKPILSIVK